MYCEVVSTPDMQTGHASPAGGLPNGWWRIKTREGRIYQRLVGGTHNTAWAKIGETHLTTIRKPIATLANLFPPIVPLLLTAVDTLGCGLWAEYCMAN